jgi:putative ABC transport system permease protein
MRALDRKLWRDLWHLRGQMLAIAAVVACGVGIFICNRSAYRSLLLTREAYYAEFRFADVFAHLKRAPDALAAHLAAIPGVVATQTRIVFEVTLDVPGLAEPAAARIQSIPERHVPMLNDLYLRRGRWVEPGRRDEVLISDAFAKANQLEVGDSLGAILNGRWETLRIVGVALSPEHVYELRGADIFPDNKRFGLLWMSRDAMGPAFDMDGAFNNLTLALAPGANESAVIAQVDRLLERYGGLGAYGRKDQISHRFLSDEIEQNRAFGTVLPTVFLGVAAFLLNIVLSRLVSTQRDQIAVLKAFGYPHRRIGWHYAQFALIGTALGGVGGVGLGLWIGTQVNKMYADLYKFPLLRFEAGADTFAIALLIAAGAALLGAWSAARRALALPPAEAMRPEAPPNFHAGALERTGLQRRLPAAARMIVRNIVRRPGRAAAAITGMACAVALLLMARFFVDAIQMLADVQFRLIQRDDITLSFHEVVPGDVRHALGQLPGVLRVEPFRAVPARLRVGHRERRVSVSGYDPGAELRRLIDTDLRRVDIPTDGVLLTHTLAELLQVRPGEWVTVEVLEGSRPRRAVRVVGTVDELIGLNAYMNRQALHTLLREAGALSGALLQVDSDQLPRLYRELKRMPAVSGVALREVALRSFENTVARNMGIFTWIMVGFSCTVAFAIVYNAARIALSERGRELASLRVLGFTRREVAVLLLGEQALLTLASVPIGFWLGYRLCRALISQFPTEMFRMPLALDLASYGFALLVLLIASSLSALLVRRRLDRLDLVEVLKTRE